MSSNHRRRLIGLITALVAAGILVLGAGTAQASNGWGSAPVGSAAGIIWE